MPVHARGRSVTHRWSSTTAVGRRPRPSDPTPPREASRVVHIAAECWPFARTGGLGEAVSTLASHHAATGLPTAVVMPLYRQVAESGHDLERVGPHLAVSLEGRIERVRLWRARPGALPYEALFIDHPVFSERTGLYGDEGGDYADNAQRFAAFCLAAVSALPTVAPGCEVVHAHDWHAALVPVYLRSTFASSAFHRRLSAVLSVHNAAFQGHAPAGLMPALGLAPALYDWRLLEWYGCLNLLKGGLAFADMVTTVSPTHARELTTPDGGFGLDGAFVALGDRLVGIVNGLDQEVWDPTTDPVLEARYGPSSLGGKRRCKAALQRAFGLPERDDRPVVAVCARLAHQKGIDLVLASDVLAGAEAQLVVLGEGDAALADALAARALAAPERIAVRTAFSDALEHLLIGGADVFCMPSRYEPCGLAQMRALRYGVLPVAHRVGGLADTIEDGVTGFLFDQGTPAALDAALARALASYADRPTWRRMMRAAMTRDFGWGRSADEYRDVYRRAAEVAGNRRGETSLAITDGDRRRVGEDSPPALATRPRRSPDSRRGTANVAVGAALP